MTITVLRSYLASACVMNPTSRRMYAPVYGGFCSYAMATGGSGNDLASDAKVQSNQKTSLICVRSKCYLAVLWYACVCDTFSLYYI